MEEEYVDEGNYIFREGERGDTLYFIRSGRVLCFKNNNSFSIILNMNSYFGELSLLSGRGLRSLNVKALEHSKL